MLWEKSQSQSILCSCDVHPLGDRHPDRPRQIQKTTMMSPLSWSLSSMSSPTKMRIRGVPWRMICYPTCFCQQTAWSSWRKQRGRCWRKRGGTSRRNSGTGILTTSGFASRRGKRTGRGVKRWGCIGSSFLYTVHLSSMTGLSLFAVEREWGEM